MTCVSASNGLSWSSTAALQDHLDHKTHQDHLTHKDHQDHHDHKDHQDHQDQQDHLNRVNDSQTKLAEAEVPAMQMVTGPTLERLLQDFSGHRSGYVRVGQKGWFLPTKYAAQASHYLNFKPRPDDTWVVTYPRSGTTLTQEMVWLIANDVDFKTARELPLNDRFPFFEFSAFMHEDTTQEFLEINAGHPDRQQTILDMAEPGYEVLARAQGPRFIKTHFPFSLLPRDLLTCGAKVIYVARNPKDVAVSFYHLNRLILTQGYRGNFSTFWDYFQDDLSVWAPFWSHIEEGWQRRTHPNLLFMFYEDIRRDPLAAIRNTANFLGKTLRDDQVMELADHLSITNFRKNPSVNWQDLYQLGIMRQHEETFIRKGETGGWTEYFPAELKERADRWIEENLARIPGLRFPPK